MNKDTPYIYLEHGYEFLALHRKITSYDPRNTDNIMILDYFHQRTSEQDSSSIYYKLLEIEFDKYNNAALPALPISFIMIYHEINIAWVDIMHQMLFIDKAYETFHAQYKEILAGIMLYDTVDVKEAMVYRYYATGESIFHIAAKIWMFEKYTEVKQDSPELIGYEVNSALKYVLECYEKLETIMNVKFGISYLTDFYDMTLLDYLQHFAEDLKNGKII